MSRKEIGYDGFVDLFRNLQKSGIPELQFGKGFTEEEEDGEVRKIFYEIANDFGMPHIHTLKVVPEDGRPQYWVHVSDLKWNNLRVKHSKIAK